MRPGEYQLTSLIVSVSVNTSYLFPSSSCARLTVLHVKTGITWPIILLHLTFLVEFSFVNGRAARTFKVELLQLV